MESAIINFVGFTLTGGFLMTWATEEFGKSVDEDGNKMPFPIRFVEGCFNLYDKIVYYIKGHSSPVEEIEYEIIEDLPKKKAGKYELFI